MLPHQCHLLFFFGLYKYIANNTGVLSFLNYFRHSDLGCLTIMQRMAYLKNEWFLQPFVTHRNNPLTTVKTQPATMIMSYACGFFSLILAGSTLGQITWLAAIFS